MAIYMVDIYMRNLENDYYPESFGIAFELWRYAYIMIELLIKSTIDFKIIKDACKIVPKDDEAKPQIMLRYDSNNNNKWVMHLETYRNCNVQEWEYNITEKEMKDILLYCTKFKIRLYDVNYNTI